MTRGLKLQASLKILEEQRGERTSIPCIVALTGRITPVVSLQAVVDNSKNDELERNGSCQWLDLAHGRETLSVRQTWSPHASR
jgi:hypothetical protein